MARVHTGCPSILSDNLGTLIMLSYNGSLYKDKAHQFEIESFREILKNRTVSKVSDTELGELITTKELGETLKIMKHKKSLGMSGVTTEFLKVFWSRLKHFITNTVNICFENGRSLIGNWKPLFMSLP